MVRLHHRGCTIAMTVTAGIVGLSINKESGIYEKGERAVVTCHTDIAPTDSLIVSVSYNNKVGKTFSILPVSTDFTVLEQSLDSTCAVSVEVKDCQGASASIGYVVAPEGFRAGYEEPAAHAGEDHAADRAAAVSGQIYL